MPPTIPPPTAPRAAPPINRSSAAPTAAQLAMAFDGRLSPARTSIGYRLSTLGVLAVLLLTEQ